jgi:Skp family chaperone for outer membrane proteins
MIRPMTTVMVVLLGRIAFAQAVPQTTAQATPPAAPQKPAAPPAAQTPAPKPPPPVFPAGATIAYVQMQTVITGSKIGRCGSDQIKAMQEKNSAQLTAKQKDVQAEQQKMQAQAGLVSEAVMTQMQRDLERMTRDGQALATQLQTDVDNKNQDLIADFQNKVMPLLEALRKDKDLSFILSADPGGAIVALNTALDLSLELVKRLDAAYPDCVKKGGG